MPEHSDVKSASNSREKSGPRTGPSHYRKHRWPKDVAQILNELVTILDEYEPEIHEDLVMGQHLIDELRKKIKEIKETL